MQSALPSPFFRKVLIWIHQWIQLFVLAFVCLFPSSLKAHSDGLPVVGIANSYHYGFWWSDGEMQGVIDGLRERWPDVQPLVEFMDLKRHPTAEDEGNYLSYILDKYRETEVDLFIFLDDKSLKFANQHSEIVGQLPVVYGGVDSVDSSNFPNLTNIVGIAEVPDLVGTVALIDALIPDLESIYVLGGEKYMKRMERFPRNRPVLDAYRFIPIEPCDEAELQLRLQAIPQHSVLLEGGAQTFVSDKALLPSFRNMVMKHCPVPLFVVYDMGGKIGVGGSLLSGYDHGYEVAKLALRVLDGEAPNSIRVETNHSPNLVVDYLEMKRFGLNLNRLPPGVQVRNVPPTWLERNRKLVPYLTAGTFCLALVTFFLLQSNRRRKVLFDQASDAIILFDSSNRVCKLNRAGLQLFGSKAKHMERRTFADLFPQHSVIPSDFPNGMVKPNEVLRTRLKLIVDGTPRVIDCTASSFPGALIQCFFRDVTLEVDNAARIRESEERFRLASEACEEIIYEWNAQTDQVWRSKAVSSITGFSQEEVLPTCEWWRNLLHPEDKERVLNELEKGIQKSQFSIRYRIRHRNGQYLHLWEKGIAVRGEQGMLTRVVGSMLNMTEVTSLENQLLEAQKMEAIGTLAGGIAHDFNNILGGIVGHAECALDEDCDDVSREQAVRSILQAADRARRLVRQILTFSRKGAHKRMAVQLDSPVREAYRLLRAAIPVRVHMSFESETYIPDVLADPTQIHQLVMNLGTNAWQSFAGAQGTIQIRLYGVDLDEGDASRMVEIEPGRHLCIEVEDDGPGMSPEVQEKIFEPFFTTRSDQEGTGLGLSVVHGIVQHHGGSLDVLSKVGQGTRIRVFLPATDTPTSKSSKQWPRSPNIPGGGKRILIVDDELMLTQVTSKILQGNGYQVTCSNHPVEALDCFRHEPMAFDLVLTDYSMPGMNGLELANEIKALRPDIPILMMSGYLGGSTKHQDFSSSILEVLEKPLTASELNRQIGLALE